MFLKADPDELDNVWVLELAHDQGLHQEVHLRWNTIVNEHFRFLDKWQVPWFVDNSGSVLTATAVSASWREPWSAYIQVLDKFNSALPEEEGIFYLSILGLFEKALINLTKGSLSKRPEKILNHWNMGSNAKHRNEARRNDHWII